MRISSVSRYWYEPRAVHALGVSAAGQVLFYFWKPGVAVPPEHPACFRVPSLPHISSSLFWLDLKTKMQNFDFLVFGCQCSPS